MHHHRIAISLLLQRLREALDLPDEPAWRTNTDRVTHREAVSDAVQSVLTTWTTAEADARMQQARVPAGAVLTPDQALNHPAVEHIVVEHGHFGEVRLPGPVLKTATTRSEHRAPPELDGDREGVLAEIGATREEIEEWERGGAFG